MFSRYDLCLAWNWEYDAPFVDLLAEACRRHDRSLWAVTPATLGRSLDDLDAGHVQLGGFLDRASDTDSRFAELAEWAQRAGAASINPHLAAQRTWDKATMHAALSVAVRTPQTLVIPSFADAPELAVIDLGALGPTFTIKPAHGGGGDGVVVEAHSLDDVRAARCRFPTDRYLLQSRVVPVRLDDRSAWFRVLYCAGDIHPCWWDVHSHVYQPLSAGDETRLGLEGLRSTIETIARLSGLGLFSTEIALTEDGSLVAVDYVNDPVDLRLQSRSPEGVPDDIVRAIADRLARFEGRQG